MSGKILIKWRHNLCAEIAKKRYMNPENTRAMHIEIANIFFNQEGDDSDETSSEHTVTSGNSDQRRIYELLTIFRLQFRANCRCYSTQSAR